MKAILSTLAGLWLLAGSVFATDGVLVVADEFPALQVLADKLMAEEGISSQLISQTNLPSDLSRFTAVLVYIHRDLSEPAERAFIDYTRVGGKLIVLHHTISSAKRMNKEWFPFLGVTLPEGDVSKGGYRWTEGVTLDIVNLAPNHFITTNKVVYQRLIQYGVTQGTAERLLPGFTLTDSEVYLNHVLSGPHTLLLGLKYTDVQTGTLYMQSHAGWVRHTGKGWIVYLMPGHSSRDFENPVYARIVLNALIWRP